MAVEKRLLEGLLKASGNQYAGNLDTCTVYDTKYHIDTGNYMLNAIISGDIYIGIPAGKIVQWAGEKSTGKSFLTSNVFINHIKESENNIGIFIETEGAFIKDQILPHLTKDEIERFQIYPTTTIEEMKILTNNLIDYIKKNKKNFEDKKIMITIDSIGMPASEKEKADATKEKAPADMTRAKAIKSMFRTITMDLAILGIPVNLVNHQHDTFDPFNPKEESGGSGIAFSNSITLVPTKKKLTEKQLDEDGEEIKKGDKAVKKQVGVIFTITPKKSRIVAENVASIEIQSRFKIGIDRYSGLWEFLKNNKLIETENHGNLGSVIKIPDLNFEMSKRDIEEMNAKDFWNKEKLDYINKKFKELFVLSRESGDTEEEANDRKVLKPSKTNKKEEADTLLNKELKNNSEKKVEPKNKFGGWNIKK